MALGYVYEVPTPEWQLVVIQSQHAADLRATSRPEPVPFDPAEDFPFLVADASVLRTFTTDMVPSALQLAGYTAATTYRNDPPRVELLARLRESLTSRSKKGDPLAVQAVFPEAVLRQVVGGPRVMKAQLLHLMEMCDRPDINLRVVPRSAGAYPAMGCPFTWLSFPHLKHNDVVYTETLVRGEYVENRAQVEQVAEQFSSLWKLALGEGESMELIAEAAASLSR
jgi:hypothetical protein